MTAPAAFAFAAPERGPGEIPPRRRFPDFDPEPPRSWTTAACELLALATTLYFAAQFARIAWRIAVAA